MKIPKEFAGYLDTLRAKPGKKINLKNYPTDEKDKVISNEKGEQFLIDTHEVLADLQEKIFALNRYSVLIILQAMDAAGKDSAIKHVLKGVNPQGVKVTSFKAPSSTELSHHYLWRHDLAVPAHGEIAVWNRSHYENVLITRVHPELILKENIPGINKVSDIKGKFWEDRFKEINRFEKHLTANGTIVLKFFLHVSKEEQRERFIARIDNPDKNWKFSGSDLTERTFWNDYMNAYEALLSSTSTDEAPWFILPADDKWFTRVCLGLIIVRELEKHNLHFPEVSNEQKAELQKLRKQLSAESKKTTE